MDENAPYQYFEDVNWGLLRLWGGRRDLRVLDVGCGFATTSARIQQLGNQVTGIEESAVACEVAADRISRVVRADLQDFTSVEAQLGGETFDILILADVLEHLAWPVGVLRRYLRLLAPGGSVLISLPNVGLWSVRLAHLAGRWEYAETGVLDRTHLRFFTRRSARWLLAEAELEPVRTTWNPGLIRPLVPLAKRFLTRSSESEGPQDPAALLESSAYRLYLRTVHPIERMLTSLWPGMLAFQMVFEAKRVE
jgi:2-polyprenyl-3-methyl-5-hydroxy-6-metoxy-1,4-benzoquinol methylase